MLSRREHLITKVAVAILDVRVKIMPHQQDPLLNWVQPHREDVVKVASVFGRVHNLTVLLVYLQVVQDWLPHLAQVSIDLESRPLWIIFIFLVDLGNPFIFPFVDAASMTSENRPEQNSFYQKT